MSKELKYNIKTRLLALPVGEFKAKRERIISECDITRQTFHNWINIESGSSSDIKLPYLDIIAGVFGCSAIELTGDIPAPAKI